MKLKNVTEFRRPNTPPRGILTAAPTMTPWDKMRANGRQHQYSDQSEFERHAATTISISAARMHSVHDYQCKWEQSLFQPSRACVSAVWTTHLYQESMHAHASQNKHISQAISGFPCKRARGSLFRGCELPGLYVRSGMQQF